MAVFFWDDEQECYKEDKSAGKKIAEIASKNEKSPWLNEAKNRQQERQSRIESEYFETVMTDDIREHITLLRDKCFQASLDSGWHTDLDTGELIERNKPEMIALMHSELSEALEAERKDLMDDHLTHRKGVEVELADCVIRIMDFAGRFGLDIGGAIMEKIEYNKTRADHKIENRKLNGGKKF